MNVADDETELRKLRWRCRRGMRELDQLLERWLDREWRQSPYRAARGIPAPAGQRRRQTLALVPWP